jgi:uncharacterized protein GlcG (DUF336 family)
MKVLCGAVVAIGLVSAATAQVPVPTGPAISLGAAGVPLPGDRARLPGTAPPGAGLPRGAPGDRAADPAAVAPSIDLALKAAQAIAAACKQYPMALAVVDSQGVAKLVYVPDDSAAWHGYSAIRKAYTAIVFQSDTSAVVKQAAGDAAVMEKFRADANLSRQAGGLVLTAGGRIVGAIGVSGAEPGGHDEECGNVGRDRIKAELK